MIDIGWTVQFFFNFFFFTNMMISTPVTFIKCWPPDKKFYLFYINEKDTIKVTYSLILSVTESNHLFIIFFSFVTNYFSFAVKYTISMLFNNYSDKGWLQDMPQSLLKITNWEKNFQNACYTCSGKSKFYNATSNIKFTYI